MALNLNSLKNLSATPVPTSNREDIVSVETPKIPLPEISKTPENVSEKKIPATGPKISLMKLKQASGIESSTPSVEVAISKDVVPEAILPQVEVNQTETISSLIPLEQIVQEEEIISTPSLTELPISSILTETIVTEGEVIDSQESQSIFSSGGEDVKLEVTEVEIVKPKEFFPNFQISGKMDFDNDLIDLEEIVPLNEAQKSIVSEKTPTIIEEEKIVLVPDEVSNTEVSEDRASPIITPEYVAEVKAELSEGRRAGFRFFVQNKTKIIAGIGVLFSISAIAMFSGSFLSVDIEKSGKSNIQETIVDTVPNDIIPSDTQTETPSMIETESPVTPSYEIGRDYSVTKNTKKNIRTKTPTDTLTGAEIPTP